MKYRIFTFPTQTAAFRAKDALAYYNINGFVIHLAEMSDRGCSYGLKLPLSVISRCKEIFALSGVIYSDII